MGNLAALLEAQGRLGEAEQKMLEVLDAKRATLGPRHPSSTCQHEQWRRC